MYSFVLAGHTVVGAISELKLFFCGDLMELRFISERPEHRLMDMNCVGFVLFLAVVL